MQNRSMSLKNKKPMNRKKDHKIYFENIREELAKELRKAKKSIFAAIAWLTDDYLLSILEDKAENGVSVQIIISGSEYNYKYRFSDLNQSGGEIYIVGGGDVFSDKFMHNKFCVIDYKKVITGSYNWSKNASTNEENIVIVEDKLVAFRYTDKCLELIKKGTVLDFDDSNEIKISFIPSKNYIDKGENVEIQWKVENANSVSISKIGNDLLLDNKHSLKIWDDITLTLTADDGEFSKSKSIHIRTIRYPRIVNFTLSEKAIIRGKSTKLSWRTENTERVIIDNGVGQVSENGSQEVAPTKDTIYKITAIGETKEEVLYQKVIVYPVPTVKIISVPTPIKINIEADIGLYSKNIPSEMKIGIKKNNIIKIFPKIEFIQSEIDTKPPSIKEIANSLNKEVHELITPYVETNHRFKSLKKAIFDKLENAFEDDWKASQVISKIRKTYDI